MSDERQKRLKSALRNNLQRRKADEKEGLHRPPKQPKPPQEPLQPE